MSHLPLLFNLLLLLFWVRLWTPAGEFHFNPFLSGLLRLTDAPLGILKVALYLPDRAGALLVLIFLAVFRTLLHGRLGGVWTLSFGGVFAFSPQGATNEWGPHFLFSGLHFLAFLFRFWSFYLIVGLITPRTRATRATETLAFLARPFSRLPRIAQLAALLATHLGLAFAASRFCGAPRTLIQIGAQTAPAEISPFLSGPLLAQLLKTGWLAALSIADALVMLTRGLFIAIIGNFAAAIFQARGAMIVCHEGVELLLGRFARNRAATGMGFDFTPLIFFFVIDMVYNSIRLGLLNLIQSPLLN